MFLLRIFREKKATAEGSAPPQRRRKTPPPPASGLASLAALSASFSSGGAASGGGAGAAPPVTSSPSPSPSDAVLPFSPRRGPQAASSAAAAAQQDALIALFQTDDDDDNGAEPATTAEDDKIIRLVRVASLLPPQQGEVEFADFPLAEFMERVAERTTAVSWEFGEPPPTGLLLPPALVAQLAHVTTEYVWIDPLCTASNGVMRQVFTHSHSLLVHCCEEDGADGTAFSAAYFASSKTLVQRLLRNGGVRGTDLFPARLSVALSHCQPLAVDADVQAQWGVRTAQSMTDLQLSSTADSPEETALKLVCEQVLERYPVLSVTGLALVPVDAQCKAVMSLVLRLSALFEWFSHPDAADSMWKTISVPPDELKLTLMALMVQKIGNAAGAFADDAMLDILWEMEQSILGRDVAAAAVVAEHANDTVGDVTTTTGDLTAEEEEEVVEYQESQTTDPTEDAASEEDMGAHMGTFGQLILGLWSLLLARTTRERCDVEWLQEFLVCGQTRYTGDWLAWLQVLFNMREVEDGGGGGGGGSEASWERMCRVAGVFQPRNRSSSSVNWLADLSLLPPAAADHGFFALHSHVLVDLPSTDCRNFGVLFPRGGGDAVVVDASAPTAPESIHVLFGAKPPDFLLGFILSSATAVTSAALSSGAGFGAKLRANVHRVLHTGASTNKPYGLFVCVRLASNQRHHRCRCVLVRALATPRKEWAVDAVCTFASEYNADGGGMDQALQEFVDEVKRVDDGAIVYPPPVVVAVQDGEEAEGHRKSSLLQLPQFMLWPIREDGQRRTTFRLNKPPLPVAAAAASPTSAIAARTSTMKEELVTTTDDQQQEDEEEEEKTTFEWAVEKPRFDKAFAAATTSTTTTTSSPPTEAPTQDYHSVLQRNYVHEMQIAEHIQYFGQVCELVAQHVEQCSAVLLDDEDVYESLDFLCEDMKDALDLAREDGLADDDALDFARDAFRKLQRALHA